MGGVLHVVATPIGNLGDLSTRARETLATVDLVVAEDTRRTGKLLATLRIDARMRSMFEGNERRRTEEVLAELRDGRSVALVSDGGTPLVSDPGFLLVRGCIDEGIDVRVVPGGRRSLFGRFCLPIASGCHHVHREDDSSLRRDPDHP